MATQLRTPSVLAALRVLVIEDEFFLADDIADALRARGATVVGPVATPAAACAAITEDAPDCALLDLNLGGEIAFPLARTLREANVPFVFATGYGANALPEDLVDAPRIEKPFEPAAAAAALEALCG